MKHKLTLPHEQITRVTLLDPGNLHQPCFPSHMYEGQYANESKQINLFGIGQLDHVFFLLINLFLIERLIDQVGQPGVLSLWLLSFINREFGMLILNDLKDIHSISGILKNRSHQYNNHDCTTTMSKK